MTLMNSSVILHTTERKTGVTGGKGVVFLFSDTQIVKEPLPRNYGVCRWQPLFYVPENCM